MRHFFAVAALCVASSSALAQPVTNSGSLSGDLYSVDYATSLQFPSACGAVSCPTIDPPTLIVGNSLLWNTNFTVATGGCFQCVIPVGRAIGDWNFTAASGYVIDGFTVAYALSMTTETYTFVGGEYPNLPPGTVAGGTGFFLASTGGTTNLGLGALSAVVHDQVAGSAPFSLNALFAPDPFDYCPPNTTNCGGGGERTLPMTLTLNSITITPHVTAVPEPSTWALMSIGAVAMQLIRRKRHIP